MNFVRFRAPGPVTTGFIPEGQTYTMGARINNMRRHVDSSLQRREDCKASAASNTCEKPVGSSAMTLPIVLGIVIPVVAAIIVLIFLHRRNVRREALEDAHDPNKGLDFGLDDGPGKRVRRSLMFGGGEKGTHKGAQLSMDMNLSSPYLLPPGAHGSHESIHSLARTLQHEQDPYRHVAQYTASEAGSVRSFNPRDGSPYSGRNKSNKTGKNLEPLKMPPRNGSMPRSPTSAHTPRTPYTPRTPGTPEEKEDPFASPKTPKPTHQLPSEGEIHDSNLPVQPIVPEIETVAPGGGKFNADEFEMPDIPPPPPVAARNRPDGARSPVPEPLRPGRPHDEPPAPQGHSDDQDGFDYDIPSILAPGALPHELENGPLYDHLGNQPSNKPPPRQHEEPAGNDRGRSARRPPPPPNGPLKPRGLKVPQPGGKRLSVGFRPLPPNEVIESDDPEFRANRIRSFYKEYFDESKEAPPPLPTQPQKNQQNQQSQQSQPPQQPTSIADYYEDYDDNYLGDAAYYDAETNTFIMPYAQPVTRRAMTPPPASRPRDGPAPGGPPRGPRGSASGMSLPGGSRPRAGSAVGPRPGSSASGRWGRGPPQKKLPPPSPLSTLPTPGKLKDDAFAIMGAIDFAPPTSIREHVAGRSQSPLGERRPYQPKVPVASPLVTAFDELPALPSPHMLRKSTTFTALDFAPPKKFKDSDNQSETGSIRSNKSGISAVQLNAIRGGAGRVSRLPGDTVFTQAEMDNQLKPQWGMRP